MPEILLQPAYLLHARPFRDTSLLLDFLTRDLGRLSAVARGARGPRAGLRALLQPFTPLRICCTGKSDLKTLTHAELVADAAPLQGESLFAAMYLNELLVRLTWGHEVETALFEAYEHALARLKQAGRDLEPLLRCFEITLLDALGYGIPFEGEAESGEPIEEHLYYRFVPEAGFMQVRGAPAEARTQEGFPGHVILAIGERDFAASETRKAAKRLLRQALTLHLGDKPLYSRRLFAARQDEPD